MDPAPYCVNNAAAGGDAASTYQKKVHKLSSTSVHVSSVLSFDERERIVIP